MSHATPTKALVGLASTLLDEVLARSGAADRTVSAFFRSHRSLGPRERALVAESV